MDPSGDVAKGIIDANRYLVLATADEAGPPWASPVYFATAGSAESFWLSSPQATVRDGRPDHRIPVDLGD